MENFEIGAEVQEVAEPAETGVEEQEVAEPVEVEEIAGSEPESGKNDQDTAFAEMRRAKEEAEAKAKETERELEQLKTYRGLLGRVSDSEVPEIDIVAQALGISPEELESQLEEEMQLSEIEKQNEQLSEELEAIKLEKAMQSDLVEIQKIDPTVKDLNDLGEYYFKCIQAGMSGVDAYHATKFKESQTKTTPAPEIGKVNQSETKKDFYTKAEVESMSAAEVEQNLEAIEKSMKKW